MFYLMPSVNYEFTSYENKDLILNKFCSSVYLVKNISLRKSNSPIDFEGVVDSDKLSFRRVPDLGYSAFLPILSCEFYEYKNKVNIKINIKFHKYVNVGLVVYLLFQLLLFTPDIVSFAMLIIPYFIVLYFFNIEIKFLMEKLNEIIYTI